MGRALRARPILVYMACLPEPLCIHQAPPYTPRSCAEFPYRENTTGATWCIDCWLPRVIPSSNYKGAAIKNRSLREPVFLFHARRHVRCTCCYTIPLTKENRKCQRSMQPLNNKRPVIKHSPAAALRRPCGGKEGGWLAHGKPDVFSKVCAASRQSLYVWMPFLFHVGDPP